MRLSARGRDVHGHDEYGRTNSRPDGKFDATNTYAYDGDGAPQKKTTKADQAETTYFHDVYGRLTGVNVANGPEIAYYIDPAGRRIAKLANGAVTYKLVYRSGLQPVAMLNGNDEPVAQFVYALGRNVPDYMIKRETKQDGTTEDRTYRIVTDQRGSVRLVVRVDTGVLVQRPST